MKNILILTLIIISTSLFFSCDELDGPTYYEDIKVSTSDTVNKILIEEFTGHKCGNCPRAHKKLEQLQTIYPDRIIPVGFHVGFFALPSQSGSFTADYRSVPGDEINSYYNVSEGAGLPAGIVNRTAKPDDLNNEVVLYEDDWAIVINYYENKPVDALMNIDLSYNTETRNVAGDVTVNFLNELDKEINIVLYVIEDSIVSWQKDYASDPNDIENYAHRHVFRDVINTTWGEEFVSGSIAAGQNETYTFSYTLNEVWNENHCEIIAYIYDAETREIIQVEHEMVNH